jgi:peptidoglycan/LPS O-acetylase OafA/YrhL
MTPPRYRADIDGLRALAVSAVIVFHTFPKLLPGGFVGVDIFFVISGYLITQLILGDLDRGRFSIAAFYARRIRRIFPALILVLATAFALGWYFLLPAELVSFEKNLVASVLFSANLMLLSEVGYFDLAAHVKPLLHLWSLGIEEQFYLVWPWLLWVVPRKWLMPAIVAALAASFALDISMLRQHPDATFYLPFTRAWELLAGAVLAQWPRTKYAGEEFAAWAGLAAIAAALVLIDARLPFPGWAAVLPVGGAALLLRAEGSLVNRALLSNPWAVNVGLISYPLYLWHWPLLVFAEIFKFRPLTDLERGLIIALTFLLAWLTYKFVERPIRFGRRPMIGPLVACMAALALAALLPAAGYGPSPPQAIARLITIKDAQEGLRVHECMLLDSDANGFAPSCTEQKHPLIAVWGDSTASALIPGFRKLQQGLDFGIAQYTVSSCPPVLLPQSSLTDLCIARNHQIVKLIGAAAPDIVLLHALWSVNDSIQELKPTIDALRAENVRRIVILGAVPVWRGGLPAVALTWYRRTGAVIPEKTRQFVEPVSADATMRNIAAALGVDYISARDALCDSGGCLARIGESLAFRDGLHLTPAGSEYLLGAIAPELHIAP